MHLWLALPLVLVTVSEGGEALDRSAAPAPAVDERAPDEDPCTGEDPPEGCVPPEVSPDESATADERLEADPTPTEEPAPLPPGVPETGEELVAPEAAPSDIAPSASESPALEDPTRATDDPRAPPEEPELVATSLPPAPPEPAQREGLGFGVLPTPNYDADNGFGLGVLFSLYWYADGKAPYKYSLTGLIFATTKLVQDHQLRIDAVDLFDLPLRATFRGGYYQTLTHNFCGFGNDVSCDPVLAERAADGLGLTGEQRDAFVRRYYQVRFFRPYASGLLRWKFWDKPHRFELMAGWRGHYYVPGSPLADDDEDGSFEPALTPWPGSYYEKAFPQGETGFASVAQVGVMLDDRDNEPAPTEGYWVEASVRASSIVLGSAWEYVGANLTARGYLPLVRYGDGFSTVLANRLVLDGVVGDLPLQEMLRVGGSWDYTAFGGNPSGRGIRVQRYPGRIKVINQTELRADFFAHEIFGQEFLWTAVGLLDAGYIGLDWTDWGGDPLQIHYGLGGGLRLAWEKNFIVKIDIAASAAEGWSPRPYIDIGHTF